MERKRFLLGAASLDKGNMQEMTKKDGPSGIFFLSSSADAK